MPGTGANYTFYMKYIYSMQNMTFGPVVTLLPLGEILVLKAADKHSSYSVLVCWCVGVLMCWCVGVLVC
jgi:hypothetical protein